MKIAWEFEIPVALNRVSSFQFFFSQNGQNALSKFVLHVLNMLCSALQNTVIQKSRWRYRSLQPWGVTFTKIACGCACRTSKIWLSLYQFFAQFPIHQYTILERKALNFTKLDAFYNNLPKLYPTYVIWAPSTLMTPCPIAKPNFMKNCPRRQAHTHVPCQCENPRHFSRICNLVGTINLRVKHLVSHYMPKFTHVG